MGVDAKYIVRLDSDEREYLQSLIDKGGRSAAILKRARILLKSHQGWIDEQIAEFAGVGLSTVFRVRRRFVEEGMEAAIFRKNTGNRLYRKLDGDAEAKLIAVACSEAPEGRNRWTLRLLADRLVDFVAAMEDVLEVYRRPCDPKRPVVCLDEQASNWSRRRELRCRPSQARSDGRLRV